MDAVKQLLDKYEEITVSALEKARVAEKLDMRAAIIIDMASRYVSDAKYFKNKGDVARALAAFSYAHGWLDCGARCKFFVVNDERLFTVDPEENDD